MCGLTMPSAESARRFAEELAKSDEKQAAARCAALAEREAKSALERPTDQIEAENTPKK